MDIDFTPAQQHTWKTLCRRQLPQVQQHACQDYLQGLALLGLSEDIPTLEDLNQRITPRTGLKILRTQVRSSTLEDWLPHFMRHEFLITDYLRTPEQLEFCPEPDMFHDIFGHLPYIDFPNEICIPTVRSNFS